MRPNRMRLPASIVSAALSCLPAAACVPAESAARPAPLLSATPTSEPSVEVAPWEALSEQARVIVPAGAWLFQSADDHAPSLRVATTPEESDAKVAYRALARRGDWWEVETLPLSNQRCSTRAFAGLELRMFVHAKDVAQVLENGAQCSIDDEPQPVLVDEYLDVRGAYATLKAKRESRGPSGPCNYCPNCVNQFPSCRVAINRISPKLYWPSGGEAGVAISDFEVIGVRRDRDVAGRTCFRMRGKEERPLPRRDGGTAELCVDSELLVYWDETVGSPRATRLPRFLVRDVLPVAALRECLGSAERFDVHVSLSWVVNDARLSDLEFDDPRRTNGEDGAPRLRCLQRALEGAAWPSGYAWSKIDLRLRLPALSP